MKIVIICKHKYYAIPVNSVSHASELLEARKIIGFSISKNMVIAYFPV